MTDDVYDEGSLYAEERARTLQKEPYKDTSNWGDKVTKPAKATEEAKK